ncbi:MAG: hypothetical protein L3J74_18665 [Bacteroidales bacterium]|nr:hypothetical protein [Bacteroidales bacterium]
MKNIFKILISFIIVSLVVAGCQKEEINPINEEQAQLTPEQLDLKYKMDQAAQVLVQFSNDKEVLAEVQKMVDLKMYGDDYIKFKDLFQPESNSQLKSFGETKFAKRFREKAASSLKSSDSFDLEQFLIDNDLVLYVPYPVEDYPADKQVPTITFDPLDNDTVNIGYRLSLEKSTNLVQNVPKVNEDYSKSYPVYIIAPGDNLDPTGGGGSNTGGGNGSGTGSGNTNGRFSFKLIDLRLKKHFEAFFNGGSEVQIIFADGVELDDKNNPATVNRHYNAIHTVTRRQVRKKIWIDNINVVLDPSWEENELRNYFAAVEIDNTGTVEVKANVEIKTKWGTFNPSVIYKYTSRNDFIGEMELTRDFIIDSQKRPSYHGLKTHNNLPIRNCGELSFTTQIIYY